MSRIAWNSFWLAPALLGATAFSAFAQTSVAPQDSVINQVSSYSAEGKSSATLGQVTSVSQLTDVRPTDWAFQALQSLVERYGCIVGYPDRTYRGNRALTRYEFAAGLNSCLDKIQELIAAATADFVKKEDLEVVKRLQEEFASELAALRGRVESLEVRTATLEKQQFSTTTKLSGEVVFAVADTFGDRATRSGNDGFVGNGVTSLATERRLEDDRTETIFGSRARIALDSSFNGRDRLRVRLQGRNITPFAGAFTGTNGTRLGFDGNESNAVNIDHLYYRFPVSSNLRFQIDAVQSRIYDSMIETLSPFASSGAGSVSRFGRFNPIYRSNNQGLVSSPGASFEYKFGKALALQGGYFSDQNANDPGEKNGLFNGSFAAVGQLVFRPSSKIDLGLTYVRSYNPGVSPATLFNQGAPNLFGSTGTGYAANPFNGQATSTDSFSAQLQWRLTPKVVVGGWYGYSFANNRRTNEEAKISNFAGFLGFPDLGKKGNLLGLTFGMQPRVLDNDYRNRLANGLPNPASRRRLDEEPPYHAEAFYRYRLSDNIAITPGVVMLINPEGNSDNATQFVGVIRTTFSF
ncbi:carbohydrate porin [Phormidium sp. CLA17]|uniref:iron uptake porin n=1 Tax=Leptolyngbya sp. Cla-17 TaxID=2803751 RepID=UPI001492749F|nr:iron uptake porin [Leptolyngbya sp. Cla-17]MBM0742399.1 carbohydrate porin [Leptolyngbya sp. Cla-17]